MLIDILENCRRSQQLRGHGVSVVNVNDYAVAVSE